MRARISRWLGSSFGMRGMRSALADRAAAYVLLLVISAIRLWDPLPIEAIRLRTFDSLQLLWPRNSPARPVTIVDVDEESLAALGQWPWPRTRLAEMLEKLTKQGAVIVGFDVVFAEPDRMSPASVARSLPQLSASERSVLQALPDNDVIFAKAISETRVVLGETALAGHGRRSETAPKMGFATLGPSALPFVHSYPSLLANTPVLETAAAGHGLFTISPERDGILRRAPMLFAVGDRLAPSFSLEVLRVLTGSGSVLVRTDPTGVLSLQLPGLALGTDPSGQIWIHFTAHDPSRFVSAKDLLADAVPRERIAGKIVLVGTSALGLVDNKTTPIDRAMPGVEVHAQILESVLSGAMLRQPAHALAIEILIAMVVSLAIIGLAPLVGPVELLALGFVVAVFLVWTSVYEFKYYSLLIDTTFPLMASWLVYSSLVFLNYFRERSGRRRIRRAFGQYMSPALVAQLANSPEKLVLGGEKRTMTIMFSDVRGFTSISESYKDDPQGLTTLMNRLLTPLTNAILANRGTIDKYMGDAIMAFWNAPLDDPDQERNACRAALEMLSSLNALNDAHAQADGAEFKRLSVGVGVNTGVCIVGNMGSDLRFDYSVLGDTVNLASRLEGQSKNYGVQIILGDATARAVGGSFPVLEIDLLVVKGKAEAQPVWTLLGDERRLADPDFLELRDLHERFLRLYRAGRFDDAELRLFECEALAPAFGLEGLYALYRGRIDEFRTAPPVAGWNGVYVALDK
jgi:adenylate cyclase